MIEWNVKVLKPENVREGFFIGRTKQQRGVSVRLVIYYDEKQSTVRVVDIDYHTGRRTGSTSYMVKFNKFKKWARARVEQHRTGPTDWIWVWVDRYATALPQTVNEFHKESAGNREIAVGGAHGVSALVGAYSGSQPSGRQLLSRYERFYPRTTPTPVEIDMDALLDIPAVAHWFKHVELHSGVRHDAYGYRQPYKHSYTWDVDESPTPTPVSGGHSGGVQKPTLRDSDEYYMDGRSEGGNGSSRSPWIYDGKGGYMRNPDFGPMSD